MVRTWGFLKTPDETWWCERAERQFQWMDGWRGERNVSSYRKTWWACLSVDVNLRRKNLVPHNLSSLPTPSAISLWTPPYNSLLRPAIRYRFLSVENPQLPNNIHLGVVRVSAMRSVLHTYPHACTCRPGKNSPSSPITCLVKLPVC